MPVGKYAGPDPNYRTTPLSDPRRLPCGHLRHLRRRYKYCRICAGPNGHYHRKTTWRSKHKGKIYKKYLRNGWGFGLASRRRKKVRLNTQVARARARSQESRLVRNLLFREGQGRLTKLSPASQRIVRQYFHSRYDEYCTRMKFADRQPMNYHRWRQKTYGGLKSAYAKDVAKGVKMESESG